MSDIFLKITLLKAVTLFSLEDISKDDNILFQQVKFQVRTSSDQCFLYCLSFCTNDLEPSLNGILKLRLEMLKMNWFFFVTTLQYYIPNHVFRIECSVAFV